MKEKKVKPFSPPKEKYYVGGVLKNQRQ